MNKITNIVNTNEVYSYEVMQSNLRDLKARYSFLQIENIGESVQKKQIPCVRIGNGKNEVMYSASIHANEWITSLVLMKFIEDFCDAYSRNIDIFEHSAREIFSSSSIYIIPMLNPDGVNLVTGNVKEGTDEYNHYVNIANAFPSISFPDGWKANYNGVDFKKY